MNGFTFAIAAARQLAIYRQLAFPASFHLEYASWPDIDNHPLALATAPVCYGSTPSAMRISVDGRLATVNA